MALAERSVETAREQEELRKIQSSGRSAQRLQSIDASMHMEAMSDMLKKQRDEMAALKQQLREFQTQAASQGVRPVSLGMADSGGGGGEADDAGRGEQTV